MPQYKYVLEEKDVPTHWYNVLADMKTPPPPYRHPATLELQLDPPLPPPVFPLALLEQEFSQERWIEISDEVQDVLKMWRPSPLYHAVRWEKALDTPAKIYYTSGRASARRAATSPTPRWSSAITPRRKAWKVSPPRREPGSGAVPCVLPPNSSA